MRHNKQNRRKYPRKTTKRRKPSSSAIARAFQAKRDSIQRILRPGFCRVRAAPCRYGISFVVPDRVAAEIADKKTVWGGRPVRITRIPSGGAAEFHRMVEKAETESPRSKRENAGKRPGPRKAYHRSRLNDWHTLVFYNGRPL